MGKVVVSEELKADFEFAINECQQGGYAGIAAADPAHFDPDEPVPFAVSAEEMQEGIMELFEVGADVSFDQPGIDQLVGVCKDDPTVVLYSNGEPNEFYLELVADQPANSSADDEWAAYSEREQACIGLNRQLNSSPSGRQPDPDQDDPDELDYDDD